MTGDKHRGGSAQTQSWIHTTSISPAALSSCSLRHYLSHIYGHGWTKATALVMISGTDIVMTSGCFSLLPFFSTFVADPTQKVPIWWRDQCAPPRLYHRRFMKEVPWYQVDSRPPSTQIPVGVVDCRFVRLSPHATGVDSVHLWYILHLFIVEWRDIDFVY
jgi:hypothetical protein